MNKEMMEKFEALQNSNFAEELDKICTPEELQGLLAKHGIEMTMDEIDELMVCAAKQNSGELSAEDLDDVSGGAAWYWEVGKFVLKVVGSWVINKLLDKTTSKKSGKK